MLVAAIAAGVQLIGSGEGLPAASGAASADAAAPREITFGTTLDSSTGLVAVETETSRFAATDTFAYSVAGMSPPAAVFVEVERTGGGEAGGGEASVVQEASEQRLGPGATAVAFSVPASALVEDFGPGTYRMRIYHDGAIAAEGTFELVAAATPSGS